ncbi:TRAP transporter small permease subunit [Rhizobium sp. LC145]|uniref:TRAP transporter small permease n=1 Tax=Rhizobium sp. LC145 TaxID=1120688 RepID=UPI000629E387|nr:TRAP transporter small permease subunit [Rhizobium sp. LC145]KKX31539.1 C4-dicarboxylate ABC transporter [Rhizobium sp. LC145]TKT66774.1 TRAP transporter small permease subunit [Rhizobiaceae bacterium LC148]
MRRIHEAIGKFEAVAAGTLLILMVLLIFLGGLARLAAHPLNWTIDFATCFFAWACFICADIAWRRDSLMSIELLTERLPTNAQRILIYINYLILIAFLLFIVIYGTQLAWTSRARSFMGIPSISYSWISASLPFGGLLLLMTTILKLVDLHRGEVPAAHPSVSGP